MEPNNLKYYRDLKNAIDTHVEKGIKKGRREEKIMIANNLLKMSISIKQIAEGTGLSEAEIEAIKKQRTE